MKWYMLVVGVVLLLSGCMTNSDRHHCPISRVLPLSDGKILAATTCSRFGDIQVGPIFRLHKDGNLDKSFDGHHLRARTSFNLTTKVRSMIEDHQGRIVAGIEKSPTRTSGWIFHIVRLLDDGSLDKKFSTNLERILEKYRTNIVRARVALLPAKGYLIALYVPTGRLDTDDSYLLWVDDDGNLLHSELLSKLTTDDVLGIRDPRFFSAIDDSTFLIAGTAQRNPNNLWSLVRFRADTSGGFRCEWALGPMSTNGWGHRGPEMPRINSLVIEPDGSVLAASKMSLLRILTDGSLDQGFHTNTEYLKSIDPSGMGRQSNGRIIIGTHASYEEELGSLPGLVGLHSDGLVDSTFMDVVGMGPRPLGHRLTIAVQSDDAVLVAGSFLKCGGFPARSLIRLTPDGAVDTTFVGRDKLH